MHKCLFYACASQNVCSGKSFPTVCNTLQILKPTVPKPWVSWSCHFEVLDHSSMSLLTCNRTHWQEVALQCCPVKVVCELHHQVLDIQCFGSILDSNNASKPLTASFLFVVTGHRFVLIIHSYNIQWPSWLIHWQTCDFFSLNVFAFRLHLCI